MSLTCPGCRKKMVEVGEEAEAKVDLCRSCYGLWLDAGELEKTGGKLPPGGIEYGGERRCPRCDVPMLVRPSKVVELDVCPDCHGMYLDKKEIELLIKVSRVQPVLETAPAVERTPSRPVQQRIARITMASPAATASKAKHGQAPAPTPAKTERAVAQFLCDLCHARHPLPQQVVGEQVTVCGGCARKHGITHDPAARRRAEQARERQSQPDPSGGVELLSDLLLGQRRRGLFGGTHRQRGLLDLLFTLLK